MRNRWISFDCYGTLVDWRTGLIVALSREVGDRAEALLASALVFQFELECQKPHRSYRYVLSEGFRRAAQQEGLSLRDSELLAKAWPELPVFGDVAEVLAALSADGWRLAVLTNCDDDLFAVTAATLGIELDEVVTTEQVSAYKPQPAHFVEFRRRTGASETNWIHVANSWVADIVPANQLGIARVWVNRDRDSSDPELASLVLPDFTGLLGAIETLTERWQGSADVQ